MAEKIKYEIVKISDRNSPIYHVNKQFFKVFFESDFKEVTGEMLRYMNEFAIEANAEGSKSFVDDCIPFVIWDKDKFLAY